MPITTREEPLSRYVPPTLLPFSSPSLGEVGKYCACHVSGYPAWKHAVIAERMLYYCQTVGACSCFVPYNEKFSLGKKLKLKFLPCGSTIGR